MGGSTSRLTFMSGGTEGQAARMSTYLVGLPVKPDNADFDMCFLGLVISHVSAEQKKQGIIIAQILSKSLGEWSLRQTSNPSWFQPIIDSSQLNWSQ